MHTNLEIKTKTHCKGGGGQKSGVLDRRPCAWRVQISAKFRKLFFDLVHKASPNEPTGSFLAKKAMRGATVRESASRADSKFRRTCEPGCEHVNSLMRRLTPSPIAQVLARR